MSGDCLRYKGYVTHIKYSVADRELYGIIEGIEDTVIFGTPNPSEIEEKFHQAVDEYVKICEDYGKAPQKAFSGTFNVRISKELHRDAYYYAAINDINLNKYVERAINAQVSADREYESHSIEVPKKQEVVGASVTANEQISRKWNFKIERCPV